MDKLNLGCGDTILSGWINIDKNSDNPKVIRRTVESYLTTLPDNCIDEVRAHHVLEHIADLDPVMIHLNRVCINGAKLDIIVPLANTLWDCGNPDHKRKFNHKTFLYYTRDFITSDVGLYRGYDLVSQTLEREPDEWFEGVSWIVANLHVVLRVVK